MHACMLAGRQAGRQTGRQTGRQAGRQADRIHTYRQTGRQADRPAHVGTWVSRLYACTYAPIYLCRTYAGSQLPIYPTTYLHECLHLANKHIHVMRVCTAYVHPRTYVQCTHACTCDSDGVLEYACLVVHCATYGQDAACSFSVSVPFI